MVEVIRGESSPDVGPISELGGTEATSQVGYQKKGAPTVDKIKKSEKEPPAGTLVEAGKPNLSAPNKNLTNDAKLQAAAKTLRDNQWFLPSFLLAFTIVMFEILRTQKEVRYNEAQVELLTRQKIYEMAMSNAELAKKITDSQAYEKLVQSVTSFVNAGVSTIGMIDTVRSQGAAIKEVDKQIEDKKTLLNEAKAKDLKVAAGDFAYDPNNAKSRSTQLDEWVTAKQGSTQFGPEVKKLQDNLDELIKQREYNIGNKERTMTQVSQLRNDAFKQTVQGIQGALTASITFERGTLEEMKAMQEGAIQALNKYSETSSKARDDAKGTTDRIADFLNKIIDSVFRAHNLGTRS